MTTHGDSIAELDFLTEYQRDLHVPGDEGEIMTTIFHVERVKTNWTCTNPVPMKVTPGSGDSWIYEVHNAYDILCNTVLHQKFPALKVPQKHLGKIQMCWTHNVTHNVVLSGVFKSGNVECGHIDSYIMDYYSQLYGENKLGWREYYATKIGNHVTTEDWTDVLPSFTGVVDLPFYYSRHESLGFPIYYDRDAKIVHEMKFENKITKLLKIRWRADVNAPWNYDEPPMGWENFAKTLDGFSIDGLLERPTIIAEYSKITDNEIEIYMGKNLEHNQANPHNDYVKGKRIYIAEDFIVIKADNISKEGDVVPIKLASKTPCKAFTMMAENLTAKRFNNHSNYSTSYKKIDSGYTPIKWFTLNYGSVTRFKEMPSDYCSKSIAGRKFPICPNEPGYVPYSYAADPTVMGNQVGITFTTVVAGELRIKLEDMNPFKEKTSSANIAVDDFLANNNNNNNKSNTSMVSSATSPSSSSSLISTKPTSVNNNNEYQVLVILAVVKKIIFARTDDKLKFVLSAEETI
jgi:hypothetical protein